MELKKLYKKNDDGTIRTATVESGSQGEYEMKAIGFDEIEPTEPEPPKDDIKTKATTKIAKAE